MKPVIVIFGLPSDQTAQQIGLLRKTIASALISRPLGIGDESDFQCYFPVMLRESPVAQKSIAVFIDASPGISVMIAEALESVLSHTYPGFDIEVRKDLAPFV